MKWLANLFSKIFGGTNEKLHAVEVAIETYLPAAVEVVGEINALAPNKTLAEFNLIATKYALPTVQALGDGQTLGNVALNLGTQILQKNHAPQVAVSLLNTLIQLAVVGVKAKAATA